MRNQDFGQNLLSRLADARSKTDELFEIPRADALYDRPIPERHRNVFYLGHLEAFDWNLLGCYALNLESFHPEFDKLFAFGIDPVDGGLPSDQPSDWPSLPEIRRYNATIREKLDARLQQKPFSSSDGSLTEEGVHLNVAIEHRLMHAETFAYMLHQMPLDRKISQPGLQVSDAPSVQRRMIEIPKGTVTLGLDRSRNAFGWDNEFEAHAENVPAFEIDEYKVTNGEFLKFLREGGYDNASLWSGED